MFLTEKIPGFNELTQVITDFCLPLLAENYHNANCKIGNNGGTFLSEREAFFSLSTNSSDDERINLIMNGTDEGFPYHLLIETSGDCNSTYKIGLMLDTLQESLPPQMIDDLDKEFYKFTQHYTED